MLPMRMLAAPALLFLAAAFSRGEEKSAKTFAPEQFAALTAQIRLIAEAVGRRF